MGNLKKGVWRCARQNLQTDVMLCGNGTLVLLGFKARIKWCETLESLTLYFLNDWWGRFQLCRRSFQPWMKRVFLLPFMRRYMEVGRLAVFLYSSCINVSFHHYVSELRDGGRWEPRYWPDSVRRAERGGGVADHSACPTVSHWASIDWHARSQRAADLNGAFN